jgi:hypothetical protein
VLTLCPTRAARSPYSASPAPGADEWPGADRASWAPFGSVRLKVISVDTMLPVAMCSIHSTLVQLGDGEGE